MTHHKNFSKGLVVGRFQPFHKGHEYLLSEAFNQCDFVTIVIGSPNITDIHNPYDVSLVSDMIHEFIIRNNFIDKAKIIPVEDIPDDDEWRELILKKAGTVDIVFGDNDWVNGIFEKAGIKVKRVGYFNRNLLEGYKIRKLIREGRKWRDRVPNYIYEIIKDIPI